MNEAKLARCYLNKINNATSRNLEFSLSFAEYKRLMSIKKCQYSGEELTIQAHGQPAKGTDRTLDRYDGSLGYVKGNVYVCSRSMNLLKENLENPDNTLETKHLKKLVKFLDKNGDIDNTGRGNNK